MKLKQLVKSELKWVEHFRNSSQSFRHKIVDILLDGLKKYGSPAKRPEITEQGSNIVKFLESNEVELIGAITCIPYIKVSGSESVLNKEFVHPFGQVTLLYHVKNTPICIFTNPALRYNGSILTESDENKYNEDVLGLSS